MALEQHRRWLSAAIDGLAHDGCAQSVNGVRPDLMGTPGFGKEADHAPPVLFGQLLPGGACRLPALVHNHAPALLGAAHLVKRQVDHSRLFSRNALEHGDISFYHLARLEGSGKALVRLRMARQQPATARVPVEPMHGQRPALEPEGEAGEMVFKAHSAIFRRIDRKAGRLVEYNGLAIDEQDMVFNHRSEEHTSEPQSLMRI